MRTVSAMVGLCAALVVSTGASADYDGLEVTGVNSVVILDPGNPVHFGTVTIYRVWAKFTNPNDAIFVWGGGGDLGPCTIDNLNASGTGPGSGFLNHVFGGILPHASSAAVSDVDSYFTIGATLLNQIPSGQGLTLHSIPGNPIDVTGNSINLNVSGGVATQPTTSSGNPNPITLAGFAGDGDPALRVLLMQLVVPLGQRIDGVMGVVINDALLEGATTIITDEPFSGTAPPHAIVDCITYTSPHNRILDVTVKVVDGNNNPLAGASVTINIVGSNGVNTTVTGTTGAAGTLFVSRRFTAACYTTNVTNIVLAGHSYDGAEPVNGYLKNSDTVPDADCRSGSDLCGSG